MTASSTWSETMSLGPACAGGAVIVMMRSLANDALITSTMLRVKIDKMDSTDLYEQVAGELRRAVAEGDDEDLVPAAHDEFALGSGFLPNSQSAQGKKNVSSTW